MPSMVRMAIVARVSRLDPDAQAFLRAATVLGMRVDPPLIGELVDMDSARVDAALDRLERDRFVGFTDDRYVFNGRMLPEAVRAECVPRGEQRRLRTRAAALLLNRDGLDARALRLDLLARDLEPGALLDEAMAVADAAVEAGAIRTARRALGLVERVRDKLDQSGAERLDSAVARLSK